MPTSNPRRGRNASAWQIAERHGRTGDLAVINPGAIFGPLLDEDPGTSAALIQRLLKGSMPAAPDMAFTLIDVRDVAALHVAAMTSPRAGGHRFPVGNGTFSFMEVAAMLRPAFPAYAASCRASGRRTGWSASSGCSTGMCAAIWAARRLQARRCVGRRGAARPPLHPGQRRRHRDGPQPDREKAGLSVGNRKDRQDGDRYLQSLRYSTRYSLLHLLPSFCQ